MANPDIIRYLKQYQNQYALPQLKQALLQQGYATREIDEAIQEVGRNVNSPGPSSSGSGGFDNLFVFDQQTKETIYASIVALVISQMIVFFGDYLIGTRMIFALIWTIIYAVVGGAISGWIIAKFYDQLMVFISSKLRFLLPFCNTFFKLLFLPVLVGSVLSLIFGLLVGGALFAIGASLGGVSGGILGGLLGGSVVLSVIWSILVQIFARYFYAKYVTWKVGKYYRDYKEG